MSVFSGPTVKKKVYPLMPTGEYVATLSNLTFEQGGSYGDSLLWKWLLALRESPTDYIARDDGEEKIHHEYTPADVVLGSKSHEWISSLAGIVLADGDEPPDSDDLVGKRMVVYISHQAPKMGPNVGVLRERFVQGSSKSFSLVPPKTVARNAPAKPAPTDDEAARAAAVTRLEKLIGRSVKLETPNHAQYVALDLAEGDLDQLAMLANTIQEEVQAALDA